jgi:hypothetical protein
MMVRENVLDKNSVLILDIRNDQALYNQLHLFKSKQLDLKSIDPVEFKKQIHFKHVFLIGDIHQDFESEAFSSLLTLIMNNEMKPFSLFLHRIKPELVVREYPHLAIVNNEKKKLTQYPMVMLKCKDLGIEKSKARFQVLMGQSRVQKGDIMSLMGIKRAVIIDEVESSEVQKYIKEQL